MFEKDDQGVTLASKAHRGSSKKILSDLINVEES
jgi:hypothetical protein